jgi:hypothetical protein
MFIQVFTGRVGDAAALEEVLDRWERELRPGATGFLGATMGQTPDGRFVAVCRFESAEAARANSERPEQGAWWAEAEKCFDGTVTFHDCPEVDTYRGGGSDEAGFVQVMQGHGDRDRLRELDSRFEPLLTETRPDLLGTVRAWDGDVYTEAAYFASEAEARAAEVQEPPPEMAAAMQEWQEAMGEVTWFDLPRPRLRT